MESALRAGLSSSLLADALCSDTLSVLELSVLVSPRCEVLLEKVSCLEEEAASCLASGALAPLASAPMLVLPVCPASPHTQTWSQARCKAGR